MRWLKDAARLMDTYKVKVDPPWRTPSGWPWSNAYLESIAERHVLKRASEKPREHTTYRQNPDKVDKRRQLNGISPNFIQGLDAAALMLAISSASRGRPASTAGEPAPCDGQSDEVFNLTTIHDCVGGLAPDMPAIAKAVRMGFVETHGANPLASYREAVLKALPDDKARAKLPPLPKVGNFDLKRVLESRFFFC